MKIAIPVGNNDESTLMDNRFGRSLYYAIYDSEKDSFEFFENPAFQARGGAGVQAVEFILRKGAKAVIVPQLGPNADRGLKTSGITIFQGVREPIQKLIEMWKNNALTELRW